MAKPSLDWNDRLALINKYSPSDAAICRAFSVTSAELNTARDMERAGTFISTKDLDVDSYADLFSDTYTPDRTTGVTSIKKISDGIGKPPASATKKTAGPKKRGRKGDNIAKAFAALPTVATPVEQYATDYSVSVAVLRQSKRFDTTTGLGPVRVKKDKVTKQLMIWREAVADTSADS